MKIIGYKISKGKYNGKDYETCKITVEKDQHNEPYTTSTDAGQSTAFGKVVEILKVTKECFPLVVPQVVGREIDNLYYDQFGNVSFIAFRGTK